MSNSRVSLATTSLISSNLKVSSRMSAGCKASKTYYSRDKIWPRLSIEQNLWQRKNWSWRRRSWIWIRSSLSYTCNRTRKVATLRKQRLTWSSIVARKRWALWWNSTACRSAFISSSIAWVTGNQLLEPRHLPTKSSKLRSYSNCWMRRRFLSTKSAWIYFSRSLMLSMERRWEACHLTKEKNN